MTYRRFVALGDSTTEGLMDLYPDGGFRGWADRLALRLAELEPGPALREPRGAGQARAPGAGGPAGAGAALEPDLLSVLAGLNDMLRKNCDVAAVAGEIEAIVVAARAVGADVLTFTLPDPVQVNPLARNAAVRLRA